jgi:hypothetical protein
VGKEGVFYRKIGLPKISGEINTPLAVRSVFSRFRAKYFSAASGNLRLEKIVKKNAQAEDEFSRNIKLWISIPSSDGSELLNVDAKIHRARYFSGQKKTCIRQRSV